MKKLLFIIAFLFASTTVFAGPIEKLTKLADKVEREHKSYDDEDWAEVAQEYAKINAEFEKDEYTKEVKRAAAVCTKNVENKTYNYKFAELMKGDYHCLILYSGDEPFNKATDNYDYIIFAYNNKTKTVRYICCDSLENGADQPYYLELEW